MNLRILIITSLVLLSSVAVAADIRVSWDANEPAPEGYRVFMRLETEEYNYAEPIWQGPEILAKITGLVDGTTYAFVVRAYDGVRTSADSDEVIYTPPLPQKVIVYPEQPKSILITFGD